MWQQLGQFILRNRIALLILLGAITAFMAFHASRVQINYDFSKAIPVNNEKYKTYQAFREKFGEDGNLFVIGIKTDRFFNAKIFNSYTELVHQLKAVNGVDDIISVPTAINLVKNAETEKLKADTIFPDHVLTQSEI